MLPMRQVAARDIDFCIAIETAESRVSLRLGFRGLEARRSRYFIPRRDPVSPPNLPADAPIPNGLEPLGVNLFPMRRKKPNEMIAYHVERFFRFWVTQEPLLADPRLERHITTVAKADIVFVRLGFRK